MGERDPGLAVGLPGCGQSPVASLRRLARHAQPGRAPGPSARALPASLPVDLPLLPGGGLELERSVDALQDV